MKKLYILSTYTGTVLSFLIKKITKVPYAHISLCLDCELDYIYSFGRKYVNTPIIGGFVREYLDKGLYKKMPNTMCRVYSIDVTDSQYNDVVDLVSFFEENKNRYKYDVMALVKILANSPDNNVDKFVCSQFVAYVLKECDINLFDKSPSSVTPLDFYLSNKLKMEYEGLLCNYRTFNLNRKNVG